MQLGFIGIGAMGEPMAKRFLDSGHPVYIYDVSEQAMQRLAASGAHPYNTPAEIAQHAEIVFLSLPNAQIVESTLRSMLGSPASVQTVVDLSSIPPDAARKFSALLKPLAVQYVDCPVSGGVGGAVDGTLTLMASGPKGTVEYLTPLLSVIGKKIRYLGEVGNGSAMKMVNNYMLACNMAAAAEALALGEKMGLDIPTMREMISTSSGRSFITENKVPNFIEKRNFAPGFAVDLQYKDLGIAEAAARSCAMPLFMGSAAAQLYQIARSKGFGTEDISSLIKICESWPEV